MGGRPQGPPLRMEAKPYPQGRVPDPPGGERSPRRGDLYGRPPGRIGPRDVRRGQAPALRGWFYPGPCPCPPRKIKNAPPIGETFLVEEGGFEPPKRIATDLQSAPFGHSGTPPYSIDSYSRQIEAQRSGFDLERRRSGGNELPRLRGSERSGACADDGAGGRTRTPDLLITNQLLYQLSYTSLSARPQQELF